MEGILNELVLFLRLAEGFKQRLKMQDRDRALVIAACCASVSQFPSIAAFCRQLVLKNNAGHMLRRWPNMESALQDPDFIHFLKQVRRKLPVEGAESMLIETGYECDVRRDDYSTDKKYVAAVMGLDSEWLDDHFG